MLVRQKCTALLMLNPQTLYRVAATIISLFLQTFILERLNSTQQMLILHVINARPDARHWRWQIGLRLSLGWLLSLYFNSFIKEKLGINYSWSTFIFHCQFLIIFNSMEELPNLHSAFLEVNLCYGFSFVPIMNIILESKAVYMWIENATVKDVNYSYTKVITIVIVTKEC